VIDVSFIRHKREREFAINYFNHNQWKHEHKMYCLSNGDKYRPDFKDELRNVIIEVVGSRQAYHANKQKYARFIKEFPNKVFELRDSEGQLLIKKHEEINKISKKIIVSRIKNQMSLNFSMGPDYKKQIAKILSDCPGHCIMKSRKVKIKISQIIKMCGGKRQAAEKLNISLRWLYYLEKGIKTPGWHLYRDICEICDKTIKK